MHPVNTQRIDARHQELHRERLAATTAVVDTAEPEHMHHLENNAKKQLQHQERQFEIDQVSEGTCLMGTECRPPGIRSERAGRGRVCAPSFPLVRRRTSASSTS